MSSLPRIYERDGLAIQNKLYTIQTYNFYVQRPIPPTSQNKHLWRSGRGRRGWCSSRRRRTRCAGIRNLDIGARLRHRDGGLNVPRAVGRRRGRACDGRHRSRGRGRDRSRGGRGLPLHHHPLGDGRRGGPRRLAAVDHARGRDRGGPGGARHHDRRRRVVADRAALVPRAGQGAGGVDGHERVGRPGEVDRRRAERAGRGRGRCGGRAGDRAGPGLASDMRDRGGSMSWGAEGGDWSRHAGSRSSWCAEAAATETTTGTTAETTAAEASAAETTSPEATWAAYGRRSRGSGRVRGQSVLYRRRSINGKLVGYRRGALV